MPPMTEPTCTLRGRDAGAADCLATYAKTAEDLGADKAHVAELRAAVAAFRSYADQGVSVTPGREAVGTAPGSSMPEPAKPAKAPAVP